MERETWMRKGEEIGFFESKIFGRSESKNRLTSYISCQMYRKVSPLYRVRNNLRYQGQRQTYKVPGMNYWHTLSTWWQGPSSFQRPAGETVDYVEKWPNPNQEVQVTDSQKVDTLESPSKLNMEEVYRDFNSP